MEISQAAGRNAQCDRAHRSARYPPGGACQATAAPHGQRDESFSSGPCLVRREIISLKDSVPHRLPNPSVLAFSGLAMMRSWPQLLALAQARPD